MNEIYEIEKPTSDSNLFTLVIKYLTLLIGFFVAGWFIIPIYLSLDRPQRLNSRFEIMFANPITSSVVILTAVVGWLIFRIWKKIKYGEVFKLEFLENDEKLKISTVNPLTDLIKEKEYFYQNLTYEINKVDNALFGPQRILKIYNEGNKVHQINIERTAWCRNEKVQNLIEKIKTGHNNI